LKDETFYIEEGNISLEMGRDRVEKVISLTPGDSIHLEPGIWHRFTAITNSVIIEISTQHFDEDSYRKEI
jgi:quercetin dioxygenase-like cupin family protein